MAETILKPIYIEKNGALGNALRAELDNCSNEFVTRMDSDDVSTRRRFELQQNWIKKHSETDIVGGNITEFIGSEDNITGGRLVSHSDKAIRHGMKSRCPFNQMTVMYKKKAVSAIGGYKDWFWNEDYFLWIHMMLNGAVIANLLCDLVNVRIGDEISARRRGMRYFKSEEGFQLLMLEKQIIGTPQYLYNTMLRFIGEVLAPNWLIAKLFMFTRKPVSMLSNAPDNQKNIGRNGQNEEYIENVRRESNGEKQTEEERRNYPPFSVAMSVYKNDNAEWFDRALESITNQTIKPDEIVLVVDGPVPDEIHKVINKYISLEKSGVFIHLITFKKNKGLGNALGVAVKEARNELIARMDSDDVSVSDRFEQQIKTFQSEDSIDIVGGDITEFIGDELNVVGRRHVPKEDADIKKYMKTRCAMNHMSVMYKRSAVQKSGGYQDLFWNEDYYLWIRMVEHGCKMANTGTVLVNVRTGSDMYSRRGGKKYFQSELFLQNYMKKRNMISTSTYIVNVAKRVVVQRMLPNRLRGWVFRKFARTQG